MPSTSLRAKRSNPARAKRAKQKSAEATAGSADFLSAPAGAQLDCFAIGSEATPFFERLWLAMTDCRLSPVNPLP
jgi:hypothetical protein